MRPGGGEPSLALLSQIQSRLTCVFDTADTLIPAQDRETIQAALSKAGPACQRLHLIEYAGVDHVLSVKIVAISIPKLQPRDGVSRWVTALWPSLGG